MQSVRKFPRPQNFAEHNFPALRVKIASAHRGTNEQKRLEEGQAVRVLDVEISFRDQVYTAQDLILTDAGVAVRAFSIHEVIAEKLRALIQQPIRDRYRRQDIYDIAFLIKNRSIDAAAKKRILQTLIEKCASRDIFPDKDSLTDPEVRRRAEVDWHTLGLEVSELPEFDTCFDQVLQLYQSLPWAAEKVAGEA